VSAIVYSAYLDQDVLTIEEKSDQHEDEINAAANIATAPPTQANAELLLTLSPASPVEATQHFPLPPLTCAALTTRKLWMA